MVKKKQTAVDMHPKTLKSIQNKYGRTKQMKKIITIILALAMICCTMSITAFAANEPYFGYVEMTATAYSYSSFEYLIPES